MRTSFKQYVSESINDKGTFKAVFVVGIPGAGKTYTVTRLKGAISPRVVNTDRATEYLSRKIGKPSNSKNWPHFRDSAQRITANSLAGYLDGVLPLFIDGTSNDVSNILGRAGILESLGYDIGMIYVSAPLDQAIKRAEERASDTDRHVDVDFIKKVHTQSEMNKDYFKSKFSFFKELNNADDLLTDAVMNEAFKKVQSFFEAPLENPVGIRLKEKMIEGKHKFLVPEIFSKEMLQKKVEGWYK